MNMLQTTIRFRKSSLLIAVASVVLLLPACKGKEEVDPNQNGSSSTNYASKVEITSEILLWENTTRIPNKVHLGPDNTFDHSLITEIRWTAGDEVACWNAEEQRWAPYSLTGGENTTTARFQGKAVHKDDDKDGKGTGQPALNISHAIFPLSATVQQPGTDGKPMLVSPGHFVHSIYFTMPGTQVYQAPISENPTFGTQYNVMTGTRNEANKNQVYFTSTGGVLMLRIKGSSFLSKIAKLKIVSNLDEKLWGTFTAAIGTNGVSTVEEAQDINGAALPLTGTRELILDCTTAGTPLALSTDAFTNFYFVVPYGVFSEGFTIYIDKDGDDFNDGTIITRKDNTIIQSDIKVMPQLELTENVTLTWELDDLYNQGTVTEL